jgi:zinc D-Ala-D-Ala carboxypeptidase
MTTIRHYTAACAAILLLSSVLAGCSLTSPGSKPEGTPSASAPTESPDKNSSSRKDPISELKVEISAGSVSPGGKLTITVSGISPKGTKPLTASNGLTFISTNPAVISVDQDGHAQAASTAKTGDKADITIQYEQLRSTVSVQVKASLEDTIEVNAKGEAIVTNATEPTVVVNKQRSLPEGFVPPNLVEPNVRFSFREKNEKRLMQEVAAEALEQLFAKADQDKIKLYGISAYRSYKTQKSLFEYYVRTQGEQTARQYSAEPGKSEHQTGLTIDVSSASANFALEESFAATPEGKWLAEHCAEFGFIIRYPKGKELITGYNYEPWHIRYVGPSIAQEIMGKGLTLEEFFSDAIPVGAQ